MVIDEAYAEFSGVTVLPWIRKFPQLFITRTFSKAAGLAGLRLGAVMACRESLALLRRAMPPFPVNIAALVAATTAVAEGRAIRKLRAGDAKDSRLVCGGIAANRCAGFSERWEFHPG